MSSSSIDDEYMNQARQNVISRLIPCIVHERYAEGIVVPSLSIPAELQKVFPSYSKNKYWANVFSKSSTDINRNQGTSFSIWFPLSGMPLVEKANDSEVYKIRMLDNQDFSFPIFQRRQKEDSEVKYEELKDIMVITDKLRSWENYSPEAIDQLNQALLSSIEHQAEAYKRAGTLPSIECGRCIEWEQSLIEGNPGHPLHKSRFGPPPIGYLPISYDIYNPTIHFFAVPRDYVTVIGYVETLMEPILKLMKSEYDSSSEAIIPVHEIQIPIIKQNFPIARHIHHTEKAQAQASIRSVILQPLPELNFKISLAIRISNILNMRTIKSEDIWLGETLSLAIEKVVEDKELLIVAKELGGILINHSEESMASHFNFLIRQDPEYLRRDSGEKVIVCAALFERRNGIPAIQSLFKLESLKSKTEFLKNYVQLYIRAFIQPVVKYGFLFEAHAQNVLGRFKYNEEKQDWELIGFIVRDFSGIHVSGTFEMKTGIELGRSKNIVQEHNLFYDFAYFAMIQLHLQQLVRSLDLHYDGSGWKIIKSELETVLPKGSDLRRRWLDSETTCLKPYIRTAFDGYRTFLPDMLPNLLTHEF